MERFGAVHHFGEKIGADLIFDGRFCCGLELSDGRKLRFYADGSIVVGDQTWTPPTIMLRAIREDLRWIGKNGIESNPEKILEFCRVTQKWLQEYMKEAEDLLKKSPANPA